MPHPQLVFLDVDGTYAHHGVVPDAHVRAVRAARRGGAIVLLCTGRPISALPDTLTGAGFDGYVCSAGAYAVLGEQILLDIRFPLDLAARVVAVLDKHGTHYILESPEGLFAGQGDADMLNRARHAYDPERRSDEQIQELGASQHVDFAKVVCLGGDTPLVEVAREIGPEVAIVPTAIPEVGEGAGEIYLAHITKAIGMRAVMEALRVDREYVIAFGDGLNDVEMLELAGTGVAIEGSDPRVLAAADRTARGPEHDGLAAAFAELGLTGD